MSVVPFAVSFDEWFLSLESETCCNAAFFFFVLIDILFLVDWVLGFVTAFHNRDGELVVAPKAVFMHYVYGWCLIDLVSAIPIDANIRFSKLDSPNNV